MAIPVNFRPIIKTEISLAVRVLRHESGRLVTKASMQIKSRMLNLQGLVMHQSVEGCHDFRSLHTRTKT